MRTPDPALGPLRFGRFELRPAARQLLRNGREVAIGGRAFDLLCALAARRDRVVSQDELLGLVWPGMAVETNNLQVQVWALRRLLGARAIATVARRGYRFLPELAGPDAGEALPLPRAPGRADATDLRSLLLQMQGQARVTLVGPADPGLLRLTLACARRLADASAGAVWHLDGPALAGSWSGVPADPTDGPSSPAANDQPDLDRLMQRLAGRADVVLLSDLETVSTPSTNRLLVRLATQAPALRLLALATRALGYEGELAIALPRVWSARRKTTTLAGSGLRWQARGR